MPWSDAATPSPGAGARLFQPLRIRGLTLENRIVISPMCQHAADDGRATDWLLVHLGKFVLGGAGLVLTESTAVAPEGRIGLKDLGLWRDDQIAPLARVVEFVHAQGGRIGVQLAHAGRKAGSEALWEGGRAFSAAQLAALDWSRVGPSAMSPGPGWTVPEALDAAGIAAVVQAFKDAARRADAAGVDCVELHFGHGYLAASFLSPISNHRSDAYGGSRANRMRLPLEIARTVREALPANKPLFCRISAVDGAEGGWGMDDSIVFARELATVGVDVIDVSSGGLSEETRALPVPRGLGFQVGFAETIRRETGLLTQAVGMIVDGPQAEDILARGQADLIAIGRAALEDPYWPRRAWEQLHGSPDFAKWPVRHGVWLAKREQGLGSLLEARRRELRTCSDGEH
jgi:2,4-dienoyl-CoA reductase-like NADH-dependent reductase (Old Yellow Enzyme family)